MTTTYIIEALEPCGKFEAIEYCSRLYEAKRLLNRAGQAGDRILCLKGMYYGEGSHAYALVMQADRSLKRLKFN